MLITSAKLDEEASAALIGKFKALIEANGTIDGIDEWGKRRLAYPINKEDDGVYTLIYFTSEVDFPAELDRVYNITDGVLRYQTLAKVAGMTGPADKKAEAAETKTEPEVQAEAAAEPAAEAKDTQEVSE